MTVPTGFRLTSWLHSSGLRFEEESRMDLSVALKSFNRGEYIRGGSEIHRFMVAASFEVQKLTLQLNQS